MATKEKEPTGWITVNGKHIPIGAGETKEEAINKALAKDNKEKQIEANKKEADKKNAEEKQKDMDKTKDVKSLSQKQLKDLKNAEKTINEIHKRRINGGAKDDDYKVVRDILQKAPVGTVMIQTGDRGVTFQFIKTSDGDVKKDGWSGSWDSNSHKLSMGWSGNSSASVKFTSIDKALSEKELKESEYKAVSGKLDQWIRGAEAKRLGRY